MTPMFVLGQATLSDVCGIDPGLVCWLVFGTTDNEGLVEATELIGRPMNAAIILALTWLADRFLRRLAVADSLMDSHGDSTTRHAARNAGDCRMSGKCAVRTV